MHHESVSTKQKKLLESILERRDPDLLTYLDTPLHMCQENVKERIEDCALQEFLDNLDENSEPNQRGLDADDLVYDLQRILWPERW